MSSERARSNRQRLGVGIIGAGRIGTFRGRFAAAHPSVDHIAVADRDESAAQRLGDLIDADHVADAADVIASPDVTTVIVATSEGEHLDVALAALAAGKSVLIEKPIALSLEDADAIVGAAENGVVRVGYTRRYRRRYALAVEQVRQGRLGELTGVTARVYNSRSQAMAMLERNPGATPVVDALTYYVDLVGWIFGDARVAEVTAMSQGGVLRAAGHDADDVTWALLRMDTGAVVSLGVSYALPSKYPARGHATRLELLGTDGVLLIDDDHTDQVMHTEHGLPHVYLPDDEANTVFLSSGTPGDWALGSFLGPLEAETRAWLDHLATGAPCHLATAPEARETLAITLAIEEAVASGGTVSLG